MGDPYSPLRTALRTCVLDRSRLKRREIGYEDLWRWQASRIDAFERVYMGAHSVTIMTTGTKLIAYDQFPATDGELAREYLRLVFEPTSPWQSRSAARGFDWQAPIFSEPVRSSHLAYVDITAAYWQLVSVYPPDARLLPSGALLEGSLEWLNTDDVAADRELRHAIVGCLFSNHIMCYRRGKPEVHYFAQKWANPSLKRMAMQTLHALAGEVRDRFGLHAWLTDACIVDATKADDVIDYLVLEWGISARVVAFGPGAVYHETCHEVGDKRTMDLVNGTVTPRTAPRRSFTNLQEVDTDALRRARLERLRGKGATRPTSSAVRSGGGPAEFPAGNGNDAGVRVPVP